jgi:MFS family permease
VSQGSDRAIGSGPGVADEGGLRATVEIIATGLGALMAALAQTLIVPVLPEISRTIHASATASLWLLTSTLLAAAVSVPILGRLADMFGRRRMLMISLGALAAGSVIDALTSNVGVMIAGRALSGVSSAAIPLGISLLAATLPQSRKGSAVALISAMLGVGAALGLPLAGLIADNASFRVLFWIGAAGALVSVVLIRALVPEPGHSRDGTVDLPGAVLLSGGLICLILPLSEGSVWGWTAPSTLIFFAAAIVLLALLRVAENHSPNPLVNLRALANPPVAITNVAGLFIGFALFASFVGTSNYVQEPKATGYGFGSSVFVAGMCLLPSGVLMLVLAPSVPRLSRAWGAGRVLAAGGALIWAGLLERIFAVGSLWEIIIGTSLVGMGTGIGYAALPTLINSHTPAHDLAAANGINSLARALGSTFASALGGTILAGITMTVGGIVVPSLGAYRVLFAICALAALLAALAGLIVNRWNPAHSQGSAPVRSVSAAAGS